MSNSSLNTLQTTEYEFEGQTGVYHGKVRDVYTIRDKYLAIVASDRISAFDVILPRAIPYKGQVLNQLALHFLKSTEEIIPNWLLMCPDPNVSIGYKCEPFKVEIVVRGMLVGHAWREYEAGKRAVSGEHMPEGMQEYEMFDNPLVTPSTKAQSGHDEDISKNEIVRKGLMSEDQYEQIKNLALKLFKKGQDMADDKGLIMADTKYEFGLLEGKIVLIDEVHTPDSSRYFYRDGYNEYMGGSTSEKPRHLSKEFVRSWLMENNFSGKSGETMPEMTDDIVQKISERYIELYERLTGLSFVRSDSKNMTTRIENNIAKAIRSLQ